MKFVAVIPARGGSKGVPRKNIINLNGKPLISYAIQSAKNAKLLDEFIVSTDDEEIAEVAVSYGANVPFLRPKSISEDSSKMIDVMLHSYEWLKRNGKEITALVLLQPTSPFRNATHIDEAITIFKNNLANTVVSVAEAPHQYNPYSLMEINEDGEINHFLKGNPFISLRQEKPKFFARNGPSILIIKTEQLIKRIFYGEKCFPYIMNFEDSLDIDSYEDLIIAEDFLKRKKLNYFRKKN